jgi:hypothetical protein
MVPPARRFYVNEPTGNERVHVPFAIWSPRIGGANASMLVATDTRKHPTARRMASQTQHRWGSFIDGVKDPRRHDPTARSEADRLGIVLRTQGVANGEPEVGCSSIR